MEEQDLISIIIPIFNVDKWLKQCLDSLMSQTYNNIEVLLIDDGSTDNSANICFDFVKNDKRFLYFKKINGGLSDARNYGIKKAKGDYIAFIDSDDFVSSHYIEKLYNGIRINNADIAICGFNEFTSNANIPEKSFILKMTDRTILSGKDVIALSFDYKIYGWSLCCAWNKLYKKSLFAKVKFEKGRLFEDDLIFPQLFVNINRVVLIHEPLYQYRQRENSIMHSLITKKKIEDAVYSDKVWMSTLKKAQLTSLYKLSIQKYKNTIMAYWIHNKQILKREHLLSNFQNEFRKYERLYHSTNMQKRIRDFLGFISLNIPCFLYKLVKRN